MTVCNGTESHSYRVNGSRSHGSDGGWSGEGRAGAVLVVGVVVRVVLVGLLCGGGRSKRGN